MTTVLTGGDICPIGGNSSFFKSGVGDSDVGEENFGTVSRIAAFVDRNRQAS